MTLSLRNTLIKSLIAFSITLVILFILSIFYMNREGMFSPETIESILQGMNLLKGKLNCNFIENVIHSVILIIFSLILTLTIFHYFKKKISPEIFFFLLFILSLSFQNIRLFQYQIISLGLSPYYGVILTRTFYFFRISGVFCLFASSLFPSGIRFQKFGTILISIVLLSFTISTLMPVDFTVIDGDLLYILSDKTSMIIMNLSIRILTIINFTRVAIMNRSKDYLLILISALIIIIGDELLYSPYSPYSPYSIYLSLSLLFTGIIIYARSIYSYYLWI